MTVEAKHTDCGSLAFDTIPVSGITDTDRLAQTMNVGGGDTVLTPGKRQASSQGD